MHLLLHYANAYGAGWKRRRVKRTKAVRMPAMRADCRADELRMLTIEFDAVIERQAELKPRNAIGGEKTAVADVSDRSCVLGIIASCASAGRLAGCLSAGKRQVRRQRP
ncbi:hypothetical protein [Caballeronia novacaledonica]|uniref:hypothetical protein n=1 Tax=Caballeronia novacaledonica TaxID=1544861 RepID=UPI000D11CE74|nr:hypothetical protein [Caballeronia novacaledonica]